MSQRFRICRKRMRTKHVGIQSLSTSEKFEFFVLVPIEQMKQHKNLNSIQLSRKNQRTVTKSQMIVLIRCSGRVWISKLGLLKHLRNTLMTYISWIMNLKQQRTCIEEGIMDLISNTKRFLENIKENLKKESLYKNSVS